MAENKHDPSESELSDIVLNKGSGNNNSKKILLAISVLIVVLIAVIVFMKLNSSDNENSIAKEKLPAEPTQEVVENDPLFEPVEVDDYASDKTSLDKIASKLKKESTAPKSDTKEEIIVDEEYVIIEPESTPKPTVKKESTKPVATPVSRPKQQTKVTQSDAKAVQFGKAYIQVGSFARFKPNSAFLTKINNAGYYYFFHKVEIKGKQINKVLVGPFDNDTDARKALNMIRKKIEPGAFIVRL